MEVEIERVETAENQLEARTVSALKAPIDHDVHVYKPMIYGH